MAKKSSTIAAGKMKCSFSEAIMTVRSTLASFTASSNAHAEEKKVRSANCFAYKRRHRARQYRVSASSTAAESRSRNSSGLMRTILRL